VTQLPDEVNGCSLSQVDHDSEEPASAQTLCQCMFVWTPLSMYLTPPSARLGLLLAAVVSALCSIARLVAAKTRKGKGRQATAPMKDTLAVTPGTDQGG
jgi:hypothetical protein